MDTEGMRVAKRTGMTLVPLRSYLQITFRTQYRRTTVGMIPGGILQKANGTFLLLWSVVVGAGFGATLTRREFAVANQTTNGSFFPMAGWIETVWNGEMQVCICMYV
jgi:hypothetical protein